MPLPETNPEHTTEATIATPRAGNTLRETTEWLDKYPDDPSLQHTAAFIGRVIQRWYDGSLSDDQVLDRIYGRYRISNGQVSDEASTVLMQAGMWFSYEADLPMNQDMEALVRNGILESDV